MTHAFGYNCVKVTYGSSKFVSGPFLGLRAAEKERRLANCHAGLTDRDMVYAPISKIASKFRQGVVLSSSFALLTSVAVAQATPDSPSPVPAEAAASAESGPSKEQCIESHRQAQLAQNEGKLVPAREFARTCTALACPGLIISDCARWLSDLDQRIPSVVFEVRVDGEPNTTASVTVDGKPVNEWTRGQSLRLDPGDHEFRFELDEYPPIVRKLLLSEGMRYRVISIEFKSPSAQGSSAGTPAKQPEPAPSARHIPVVVYPLLGGGALGLGGFTLFGLIARSKQHDLENSCRPNCTSGDLKSMKTSYLIGDISLGLGVASLVAAGLFYFEAGGKSAPATVGLSPLPGGAAASAAVRF